VYEKIHDMDDLRKRLMYTSFDFDIWHYRCYDWPVAWPSENMCACRWWTLWTYALKWMFIYMIHQNILWNHQC